jgi:predicted ATPase/DNA-binding XRE family transcriptional regulator
MSEPSAEVGSVSEIRSPKFGLLLRKLRTEAGLSQDGLAERAGISAKTIGALEQGVRRAAHDDTIHRIARALQLAPAERDALLHAAQHSRARRFDQAEETHQSNLPTSLTSFVERREVEDIAALIASNRLVTITGTGGVGKTRTAIEVAHRSTSPTQRFWFVDLSRLRDGKTILSELASVLGIRLPDTEDAFTIVVRHLNAHPARLLLDNCEHLLDDLADLVARLLQSCSLLSILATSREPLSLSFEILFRLPSLDVPSDPVTALEDALEYSALRLFLARTESGRAPWLVKSSSLEKIRNLCRQLDGLPLAIELAASRVSTLGLDMLLGKLTKGLTLSGKRDYPERHKTMTATIAWSYDLLDPTEQALLRRLSVFAGSFSLDDAQRVCSDNELAAYTIIDACHRLAQKSLIVVDDGEPTRYRLLGAIRSFGEARLSTNERQALYLTYIRWLRELSDSVHQHASGFAIDSLFADFDNVRAGIDRCLERGGEDDLLDAAAIAGGLRRLWSRTNRNRELKHYVDYLLAQIDSERHPHHFSRLLLAACLYTPQPDFPALLARTIPVLAADGNHAEAASMLAQLATYQVRNGDIEDANRSLRDSFEFLRDIDPAVHRAYWTFLLYRAWVSCAQSDVEQASADLRQLATYLNDSTDPDGSERARSQLVEASVAFVRGDRVYAISLLDSMLERSATWSAFSAFEIRINLAWCHTALGNSDIVLQLVRTLLRDSPDTALSPNDDGDFLILIPAAAAAANYNKARLGAVILGHCKHHWLKGRAPLATEAPTYEKLLDSVKGHFSTDEMNELFDEGAALLPKTVFDAVRTDSLFAPTQHDTAVSSESLV